MPFLLIRKASKPQTQKRKRGKSSAQGEGSTPVDCYPVGVSLIQRSLACPCDGGCPHCAVTIQPRLSVGAPNDKYEQEADRIAEQVMAMPEPMVQKAPTQPLESGSPCGDDDTLNNEQIRAMPLAERITPLVQRQVEDEEESVIAPEEEISEEEEEEPENIAQAKLVSESSPTFMQRDVEDEEEEEESGTPLAEEEEEEIPEEEPLNMKRQSSEIPAPQVQNLQGRLNYMRGGGSPLPGASRAFFESRFGHDFSRVRIHTGARATAAASSLKARAFTRGHDIVFGSDQFSPHSAAGRRLLAHELTHVIQQNGKRNLINRVKRPGMNWSPAGVRKVLCSSSDRWILKKLRASRIKVCPFSHYKVCYDKYKRTRRGGLRLVKENICSVPFGAHHKSENKIYLSEKLNNKEASAALFHEMTHAVQPTSLSGLSREFDAWIKYEYFRVRHGMLPKIPKAWIKTGGAKTARIKIIKSRVRRGYRDLNPKFTFKLSMRLIKGNYINKPFPLSSWRCPALAGASARWAKPPLAQIKLYKSDLLRVLRDVKTIRIPYKTCPAPMSAMRCPVTRYRGARYIRLRSSGYRLTSGNTFYVLQDNLLLIDHDGIRKRMVEILYRAKRYFVEQSKIDYQ